MLKLIQPFKKEYMKEYLVMVLDAFKSNHPYFKSGLANEEDFLRST
jgi:hypothetical protein